MLSPGSVTAVEKSAPARNAPVSFVSDLTCVEDAPFPLMF